MTALGPLVIGLIQNVTLFALVAFGYAALRRHAKWPPAALNLAIGALFGLGAVMAMSLRIEVQSDTFVDGRNVMIGLVATFGGPIAAFLTVAMAVAYRTWLGGANGLGGVIAIIGVGLVGAIFAELRRRRRLQLGVGQLLALGAAVVTTGLVIVNGLNPVLAAATLLTTSLSLYLVVPVSIVILGLALLGEDERAALQLKLRDQATLLETVFNSISDGVAVADTAGKIILANPTARRLWGASEDKTSGARVGDFGTLELDGKTPFPKDRLPLIRALRGDSTDDVPMMLAAATGGRRTVSVSGRPLVDTKGRSLGGVVVFRDVTEANALEESLRRNRQRFREAINAMESGFALFDADDRLLEYNQGFINAEQKKVLGEPIGMTFEDISRPFAFDETLTAVDALPDREAWQRWRVEVHCNPPLTPLEIEWTDGRWMRVTERRTAEGGYVGVWSDITALKAAESRLREAIESIPEGFALLDSDMRFVIFNQRLLDLYPNSAAAVTPGASLEGMVRYGAKQGEYPGVASNAEVEEYVKLWMGRFRSDQPYYGEGALGGDRWALVSHRRTAGGDYVSVRTDITAQKQRERELAGLLGELIQAQAASERSYEEARRTTALLRAITDAVPALVAFVDRNERYAYCNKEYRDVFGIDPESLIGKHIADAVEPEIYRVVKPYIDATLAGEEAAFVRPMHTRGETRFIEQRYIPERLTDGSVTGFYAVGWDVTERHNREQVLSLETMTDVLTGLLNRRGMMEAMAEEIPRWRAGGLNGAVLFLDVDHFKQINDTLGHDAGDELLKIFAERIRGVVRASDKVARMGGDEFVIVLTAPNAEEVARRIAATLLERIRQPITLGPGQVTITASIGVAIATGTETAAHLVLKESDLALYEAKSAGRDRVSLRLMQPVAGLGTAQ